MKKLLLLISIFLSVNIALSQEGTLDTSFDTGAGFTNTVSKVKILSNHQILVGGSFITYNGAVRKGLAKINSDGSLVTNFNPSFHYVDNNNNNSSGNIRDIAVQDDGKILVGGYFTYCNGIACTSLARLNADGTIDNSFNPSINYVDNNNNSSPGSIWHIAVQDNGKILVTGNFTNCNGVTVNYLARLNQDGSLDTTFNASGSGFDGSNSGQYQMEVQPDGKILFCGGYNEIIKYNGLTRHGMIRLNSDGSLDLSFLFNSQTVEEVQSFTYYKNEIYCFGSRLQQSSSPMYKVYSLIKLDDTGNELSSFDPIVIGEQVNSNPNSFQIYSILGLDGNKIMIGGNFSKYNYINRSGIARIKPDASLDLTFDPGYGIINGNIRDMAIQDDGKIIIVGQFNMYDSTEVHDIARINANVLPLGVSENNKINIQVFPNPSKSSFIIKNLPNKSNIRIYSSLGKKVYDNNEYQKNELKIKTSSFENGVYFIKVNSPLGALNKKIIINH